MQANQLNSSPYNWESYVFYITTNFWQNIGMSDDINKIFSETSLINDLRNSLKSYAFLLTKNKDDANDLVQQVFEKALSKKEQFKSGSVKAWMTTMMKTTFIDNIRKKKEDLPGDELQEVSIKGDQLSAIEDSEAESKLDDCIKHLNEIEEDVIRLRRSEYTVIEITEITGKSRVNVSQISARAKIKLHTCMEVEL
tara:strand:+ start:542 stop:1129 length:588 start_codon:yes stop_codon:yes gene_type:complete